VRPRPGPLVELRLENGRPRASILIVSTQCGDVGFCESQPCHTHDIHTRRPSGISLDQLKRPHVIDHGRVHPDHCAGANRPVLMNRARHAERHVNLRVDQLPPGRPGHHTAIDVFVFTRDMYAHVPPLALGRAWFDQWLIKDALLHGIPVVDVTKIARAIHQQHDYGHIAGGQRGAYAGEEARHNLELYGGVQHAFTLLQATHELLPGGAIRRTRYRADAFRVQQWLWRTFVQRAAPLRKRLRSAPADALSASRP